MPKDRSEYFKQYREKNRERINEKRREWFRENREKHDLYQMRYWLKKAESIQAKQG